MVRDEGRWLMDINTIEVVLKTGTLLFVLLSIIFAFGVVWRVEKKLDTSFKLFLAAIISFFASEILGFFWTGASAYLATSAVVLKTLFAFLFLLGILMVRNMLRNIDGEK